MEPIRCFAYDLDTKYEFRNVLVLVVPSPGHFIRIHQDGYSDNEMFIIVAVEHISIEGESPKLKLYARKSDPPA